MFLKQIGRLVPFKGSRKERQKPVATKHQTSSQLGFILTIELNTRNFFPHNNDHESQRPLRFFVRIGFFSRDAQKRVDEKKRIRDSAVF
ncbi:hypothetical protein M3Y96_00002500 [Aphelenchoides besseyi]|nr:hypothetical protein M3Y96_00002500 [Aphelenchoides besseyi]